MMTEKINTPSSNLQSPTSDAKTSYSLKRYKPTGFATVLDAATHFELIFNQIIFSTESEERTFALYQAHPISNKGDTGVYSDDAFQTALEKLSSETMVSAFYDYAWCHTCSAKILGLIEAEIDVKREQFQEYLDRKNTAKAA